MHQQLAQYLQKFISAPEEEIAQFCQLFQLVEVKKKNLLLRVGEVCKITQQNQM